MAIHKKEVFSEILSEKDINDFGSRRECGRLQNGNSQELRFCVKNISVPQHRPHFTVEKLEDKNK